MIDDETVDVTAILAQPREFLRRYENVLAQLAQAQAELSVAKQETADYHRWGIRMKQERDAATVRGDTYRRRALALSQLCQRLENGERTLAAGFAVGAARKFVVDEMTARCADCGQMIMLTVEEYIKRRRGSLP